MEAVDRADYVSRCIFERIDMDHRDDARPVRTLDGGFCPSDRLPGTQHMRHRAFLAPDQLSVQPIKLVGPAEPLGLVTDAGRAPP
jgi:hypothetical protein